MSLGTNEGERRARLFSRGNREKNFPEISDVEEGVGKHRRDIPGKMIIRSWKNFGTSEREEEREKEKEGKRERGTQSSGDEAAVSRDVTVACSFIVELFPLGYYFHNVKLLVKSG